eukprot:TRINITY_DN1533_c0_g1_i3.p1 TRINITY_DN1533_c0_g1~~TRINITY_DN1533_c0_g1_i3.p1  ORF type:complete len:130 (+),score=32.75 TRINITY_DN1533_c0_g1_i3:90-479(+)
MFTTRMLLVACLVAAALADNYQIRQCTNKATGATADVDIKLSECMVVSFSTRQYNLSLTQFSILTVNNHRTLTAVGNSFTDNKCTGVNTEINLSCSCDANSELAFVCNGTAFTVPSLLVLVASVMVYMT